MIKLFRAYFLALLTLVCLSFGATAHASGGGVENKIVNWPFDGVFGTVDRAAAQRGYQVYQEVCASCHSLRLLSYRNLTELGFSADEVKAIAAEATVIDGPDDSGDMFDRPGRASDRFVAPFANENAGRASNNGAYPPDLSLMVKARVDGGNYLYSLLTGYDDAPSHMKMGAGMHYNKYFPAYQIAMPSPLSDDLVEYQDGTSASVDQMAKDVTIFLQWAAEPEMETRKRMGIKVLVYLAIFTILFYLAKKIIWRDVT